MAGCAEESNEPDAMVEPVFDFKTTRTVRFMLDVGTPHAKVEIASVRTSDTVGGTMYYQGMSDRDGVVAGSIRLPWSVSDIDIIANKAGYSGPYTNEQLREQAGPFAASARVTVPIDELDGSIVELEVE